MKIKTIYFQHIQISNSHLHIYVQKCSLHNCCKIIFSKRKNIKIRIMKIRLNLLPKFDKLTNEYKTKNIKVSKYIYHSSFINLSIRSNSTNLYQKNLDCNPY